MPFARRVSACLAAALIVSLSSPLAARADEEVELHREIADLKARLQSLENRLSKQESRPAAVAASSSGDSGMPEWVSKVELSGYADISYVYNTQSPKSRVNSLRVFDTDASGFQPNALGLQLKKPVSEDSRVGFYSEVLVGEDAEVLGSVTTGLGSQTDEIDLYQVYAEALLPVGNGLNVKAGKMSVLHGAEVVQSKDNWNFSRSYLFGFAQALTHTGVRASYPVTSWLTATAGVNNGWDVVDDNNTAKTIEWQLAATPCEKSSVIVSMMHGAEQANDNHDYRHLLDIVLGYNATEKLSFKLNYDYIQEEDAVVENQENASMHGVAGYARYQFTDWYALAGRAEYFADFDGARTATGRDVRLIGLTLTNEFKLYKDMITRLEYRHDHATEAVFAAGSSTDNSQDTFSAEVIYPF